MTVDNLSFYWKQIIQDASIRLRLPTDRVRSAVESDRRAIYPFTISPHLFEDLKNLSKKEDFPLSILLLTAFKVLLYRYAGQTDIMLGSPITQENQYREKNPIDFFINNLILRTNLSGQPSFREMLTREQGVFWAAEENKNLVKDQKPELDQNGLALPQVMFIYQPVHNEDLESSDSTRFQNQDHVGVNLPELTLKIDDNGENLEGFIEYNSGLFESSTISRMIGHLETLLKAIIDQPNAPISRLPILTENEKHQLLVEWNDTQTNYPRNATINHLFEAQTEKTPNATALIFDQQQLTYQELNQQANRIAHYLRSLGVGPEVCVGLCLERSLDMVISILGILKAGGAYVPLDPEYPEKRLKFMLADTKAPVLITRQSLIPTALDQQTSVIYLDENLADIAENSAHNPSPQTNAESLAYVMYTSGSTGQPKGVSITHRNVVRLVKDTNYIELDEDQVFLLLAPISFDASTLELWGPLLNGGQLVIYPAAKPSLPELSKIIEQQNISTLWLTAGLFHQIVDERLESLSSIKHLLTGGDVLSPSHVKRVLTSLPDCLLTNGYGPTENTTFSTCYPMTDPAQVGQTVSIGKPIANSQVYILDEYLQPVPIGIPGELYVGGDGVGRGYLDRPELTEARFIQNSFSENQNARLYKTGDQARFLPDGNIEFLGRSDDQVKIRGFRIELGEIEASLSQHPAVKDVLVQARQNSPGEKRLVAYMILKGEQLPTISEWRQFLSQKLPNYMVPSAFVILDEFPLNPNGKVDRKALPAPELDRSTLDDQFVAPRTFAEETIANIWAEILKLEEVGIYDNFFDLGGDSILSIQITSKTNQAGLYLTPDQLFNHPTIAELADIAESAPSMEAEQGLVTGPLPLTPVQHWFFEQNLPEPHHWNQAFLLEVKHKLDPALLEEAIHHLLIHHDALRLRYTKDESGWQQFMSPTIEAAPISQIDLSNTKVMDQLTEIQSIATELQASLNITEGPMIRVALFDLGAENLDYLLIIINHLAIDGVSWRILLDHLEILYQQLSRGENVQLPPKTTSFKQWAKRLAEYANSEILQAETSFWLARQEQEYVDLPLDIPEGITENTEASADTVTVTLDVENTENLLREVPKAYQTQINDVLLTALVQAFSELTGSPNLLVNLEGHGREAIFDDVDLLRTVGWFTTIFPVLLILEGKSNPGEMLKSVKEQLRRIPNRGIGYGLLHYLSDEIEHVKQLKALPEAGLSFNYLGQFDQILPPSSPFKLTNEYCGPTHSLVGNRRHLLEIKGIIVDGQLQMNWTYSRNVHRRKTIEQLAGHFMEALNILIAHCQSPNAGGYTPSDFPEADLNQQELDDLFQEISEL
jgi:amino acid adenylation domain-containing protein/non-ribosomal peptide synthase protein (TIGR01720 family)